MSKNKVVFVVINLDRDKDRLEEVTKQFSKLRLQFIRFPGVDGLNLPAFLKEKFLRRDGTPDVKLSNGEIGCFASHLAVCNALISGKFDTDSVVVLEDDCILEADLLKAVRDALDCCPLGWDIIKLFGATKRPSRLVADLSCGRRLIRFSRIPAGTVGYILSRNGAQKLLNIKKIVKAIDAETTQAWVHDLNVFGIYPAPVKHDGTNSTVNAMGREQYSVSAVEQIKRIGLKNLVSRGRFALRQFGAVGYTKVLIFRLANLCRTNKIHVFR